MAVNQGFWRHETRLAKTILPYDNGVAVNDIIARVMRQLNTKKFEHGFINWMQAVSKVTEGDVIAVDGKTLRHSYDGPSNQSPIHTVSAWSSAKGCIMQWVARKKLSNKE